MPDEALQPVVTFTGIVGIEDARFLLQCGETASQGILSTPIIDQLVPGIGDFSIEFGETTLTLTDCCVVESYVEMTGNGPTRRIIFQDRRWRWALSEIVGRHNVRKGTDTIKFPKTPQELMELLLLACGEASFDLAAVPNNARPHADWTHARCDLEMSAIMAALNCRMSFDLTTGDPKAVKVGSGAALPTTFIENAAETVTLPARPHRIRVATTPIRFQVLFELEAIGLDNDGKVKPVASLSYTPAGGWELEDFDVFDGVTGTYSEDGVTRRNRDLALATVGRWFRIKRVVGGGGPAELDPPGFEDVAVDGAPHLVDIDDLLPLLPTLNTTYTAPDGVQKPKRMRLYGRWSDGGNGLAASNVAQGSEWKRGFTVDLDQGIVKLSTWANYFPDDTFEVAPAQFWLHACCEANWRGLNKKAWYAKWRDADDATDTSIVLTEVRDDVVVMLNSIVTVDGGLPAVTDFTDNYDDVDDQLDYYLDALADRLVPQEAATASYADLKLVAPDGAIEQVEWIVDGNGMTTRIARNTQLAPYMPDWKENQRQLARERAGVVVDRLIAAEVFREGNLRVQPSIILLEG